MQPGSERWTVRVQVPCNTPGGPLCFDGGARHARPLYRGPGSLLGSFSAVQPASTGVNQGQGGSVWEGA